MTYAQIFNAIDSLNALSTQKLKVKESYKLYDFTEKINKHINFFRNEHRKIMEAHGVRIENNKFVGTGDQATFERESAELMALEVEGMKTLELTVPEDILLSRNDIELLNGVVKLNFEGETMPHKAQKEE